MSKISALPELTTPAADDQLEILDTSDTSQSPDGTNKRIQKSNLFAAATDTEAVHDIVGAMVPDTSSVDAVYDDGAGTLSLTVKDGAPPLSPATATLTDGATITWATAGARQNNARVTLGGNRTLDITGEVDGATGILIVIQDGTGGRTITLPGSSLVINDGGGAVALSTGAGEVDILTWYYDGANFFWTIGVNYS